MELRYLLLALSPSLHLAAAETVLGVYIFHRHGDRTTKSYTPVSLTALGADQCFASGTYYRSRYVADDASSRIAGIAATVPKLSQLNVLSPVDNTLQYSANSFVQGLYPPAGSASAQELANGSSVEGPLGGYQFVPVNIVSSAGAATGGSEGSSWLQGSSGCANAVVSSNGYFASEEFLTTLADTKDFYQSLSPVINGTFSLDKTTFKNAYTIYDFIHVSSIHNTTIPSSSLLTNETQLQLRTRADQHEWGLAYNSSSTARAIAGAVLAAQVVDALNATLTSPTSSPRLSMQFGTYATLMSFFGLADMPAASPNFYGLVDYASSVVLELVTNSTTSSDGNTAVDADDVSVRFLIANGSASDTNPPVAFPMFGRKETVLPWATFAEEMGKFSVGDTTTWCRVCGNTTGVCAGTASSSGDDGDGNASSSSSGGSKDSSGGGGVSRPVAGVIGALVTLVVVLGLEALVLGVGGLRLIKKSTLAEKTGSAGTGSVVTQAA